MIEITHAKDAHYPEVERLWREFLEHHAEIDSFFTLNNEAEKAFRTFFMDALNSDDFNVLIAHDGDTIVGYSISEIREHKPVFKTSKYGYISDMAVTSKARGNKIGERLLKENLKWFDENEINRIELKMVPENELASSFWRKHGFKTYAELMYMEK